MTTTMSRYIDPLTDFGFKHLFGSEPDKDIMIGFLNALFEGEKHIIDIVYSPTEHQGNQSTEKRVFFDLTCTGTDGETFIIEMQRAHQPYFRDRCVFSLCRLISAQVPKGEVAGMVKLKEVYLIGIMEFKFEEDQKHFMHNISLFNNKTNKVFFKGIGLKFLELANFDREAHELESDLDRWFYLLKNLSKLDKMPDYLDKRVFQKIFKIAEVSKLSKEEQKLYESSLQAKFDYHNSIAYAKELAKEEGKLEGKHTAALNIALELKKKRLDNAFIAEVTKLSAEEIEKLDI